MKPTFELHSSETGTKYLAYVADEETQETAEPLPAVLFMDGDDQFFYALKAYRALRASESVPPLLLVGIGYGASYTAASNKRGRDYTPTTHSDEPGSGGGNAFTAFIANTFWPELGKRYSLDNDIRGIAGHSLGSLLALYALFREPPFFTHVLASAPSIWWDERSILHLVAERHAQNPDLRARLFLSVGENDTESMTGDLALFERLLAEKPFHNLEVISRHFPDRNHYNVIPDAFRTGLAELFASPITGYTGALVQAGPGRPCSVSQSPGSGGGPAMRHNT